jgi:hypothetical protein
MPSPSGQVIKVVIRSSAWLEPDTTAPLILPDSISPNGRVAIPGRLQALIRHERTSRESGEILNERDTVSLLGYSERLHRSIPEFSGNIPIVVQYPLQLARPVYMDCMEKCDEMTISWMVISLPVQLSVVYLQLLGEQCFDCDIWSFQKPSNDNKTHRQ